ncbi:hypothetical protein KIW84_030194 [Lathyrus oleraceus]|uniref:Arabidopsis retrotransposon Orf1 C-terminal domain-containing protein n=1 Tax=Pisum sativum TaxID=3888 RepID=A0A9D5AYK7_PEA|nr:hypothetical protein KIW84_030194 [Pisum sativum]
MSGKTIIDWEGLKATAIQKPVIRYLHRILASTIFGQENTGNVNSKDIFLIYYALSGTKVNPTPFLLAHFQSTYARTGGPIYVGGLITSITLALNLGTELATLEPLETPFADLDYCHSMRLIKNKPDGKYSLMISSREVRGVTLPYIARINMHIIGTSSGYQPREEYDYPAMRTTLDDVLSKLIHWNDVEADHDVLLRNIQMQQAKMRASIDQIR